MGVVKQLGNKVLVLNAGSSSLKFKVFSADPLKPFIGGGFDRIGDVANSTLIAKGTAEGKEQKWSLPIPVKDHVQALDNILGFLKQHVSADFDKEVKAVGHRIVHGLDLSEPTLLNEATVDKIKTAAALAPLHNPPGLQGIEAAQQIFKGIPNVGVFDTAYHQSMPPHAFMYGLPYNLYEEHKIRRYGFHGTSHKYLAQETAKLLGKPVSELNCITCHLGSGSSIAAIKNGHSVDTTMGLTPLAGLIMGTRTGDIDPALVLHLQNSLKLSAKETDTLLNKKSGLLGITGHNDLRVVIDLAAQGDARGKLGLDMFVYQVRKFIGAYTAALQGNVDAVVFSAGIGENSSIIRGLIADGMEKAFNFELDDAANKAAVGGKAGVISTAGSRIKAVVVPTDEELSIAQQTVEVVEKL